MKLMMLAEKLPPSVRRKVERPEPAGISRRDRSDSRMVIIGMKNSATPMPSMNDAMATWKKSTSV